MKILLSGEGRARLDFSRGAMRLNRRVAKRFISLFKAQDVDAQILEAPGALRGAAARRALDPDETVDWSETWRIGFEALDAFEPTRLCANAAFAVWPHAQLRARGGGLQSQPYAYAPGGLRILAGTQHSCDIFQSAGFDAALTPPPLGDVDSPVSFEPEVWTAAGPASLGATITPIAWEAFTQDEPICFARLNPFADPAAFRSLLRAAENLSKMKMLIAPALTPEQGGYAELAQAFELDKICARLGRRLGLLLSPLDEGGFRAVCKASDLYLAPSPGRIFDADERLLDLIDAIDAGCVPVIAQCPPFADVAAPAGAFWAFTEPSWVRAYAQAGPIWEFTQKRIGWCASGDALSAALKAAQDEEPSGRDRRRQIAQAHVRASYNPRAAWVRLAEALSIPAIDGARL